ncbi:MAG: tryptophan synthase subunit alpha [bacterium]|nr:tryptophan synthase subunit alpha [bacterium]
MNRIEKKFTELKKAKRKAFIAFLTAGDPSLSATENLIPKMEAAGVDILELGVPFSDPMADGPVIQRSSERALAKGTSLSKILKLVAKIRKKSQIPILLMGYYNPILTFGVEKYFKAAAAAGVDGTLIVDLPPEEGGTAQKAAKKNKISLVYLLAPTSNGTRIKQVTHRGSGFIYYVSLTGITGASLSTDLSKQPALKALKRASKLPVCVGFGIKTPAQAKEVGRLADGVVVGSALVHALEKNPGSQGLKKAGALAQRLAQAVHSLKV